MGKKAFVIFGVMSLINMLTEPLCYDSNMFYICMTTILINIMLFTLILYMFEYFKSLSYDLLPVVKKNILLLLYLVNPSIILFITIHILCLSFYLVNIIFILPTSDILLSITSLLIEVLNYILDFSNKVDYINYTDIYLVHLGPEPGIAEFRFDLLDNLLAEARSNVNSINDFRLNEANKILEDNKEKLISRMDYRFNHSFDKQLDFIMDFNSLPSKSQNNEDFSNQLKVILHKEMPKADSPDQETY